MDEIYFATFDGSLHVTPADQDSDLADVIEILRKNELTKLSPISASGDPQLVMSTAYEIPGHPGCGCVVVFRDDEPCYALIAKNQLTLCECESHAAQMTANLRYGSDIFEDSDE